jgi:hypothetical protein
MRKIAVLGITLSVLIAGCATFNVRDPVGVGLYTIKSEWVAIREHVIIENHYGRLSDKDRDAFREEDEEFSLVYSLALKLRGSGGPVFEENLRTMRRMLLDARRKYYPLGGS